MRMEVCMRDGSEMESVAASSFGFEKEESPWRGESDFRSGQRDKQLIRQDSFYWMINPGESRRPDRALALSISLIKNCSSASDVCLLKAEAFKLQQMLLVLPHPELGEDTNLLPTTLPCTDGAQTVLCYFSKRETWRLQSSDRFLQNHMVEVAKTELKPSSLLLNSKMYLPRHMMGTTWVTQTQSGLVPTHQQINILHIQIQRMIYLRSCVNYIILQYPCDCNIPHIGAEIIFGFCCCVVIDKTWYRTCC